MSNVFNLYLNDISKVHHILRKYMRDVILYTCERNLFDFTFSYFKNSIKVYIPVKNEQC